MQWCHEIRAHSLRGFQNSFVARAVIALEAQYSLAVIQVMVARDEASHNRVPSSVLGHGGACGSFEERAMAHTNPLCKTESFHPELVARVGVGMHVVDCMSFARIPSCFELSVWWRRHPKGVLTAIAVCLMHACSYSVFVTVESFMQHEVLHLKCRNGPHRESSISAGAPCSSAEFAANTPCAIDHTAAKPWHT